MSERMSSVEIEDVLSSIRRLVSDDLRPAPRLATRQDAASKLILTPALRVVTEADSENFAASQAVYDQNEADFLTENMVVDPAGYDAGTVTSPLQTLLRGIAKGDVLAADDATTLPNPADASGPNTPSIEAVVAALGAAVTGQGWEGESDDLPEPAVDWTDRAWAERTLADVAPTGGDDEIDDAEVILHTAHEAALPADEIWLQPAEVAEAAVESSFLADVLSHDDAQILERDIADRAEAAAVAEILRTGQAAVEHDIVEEPQATVFAHDQIAHDPIASIDEGELRDLIRDIIREELQGDLGERITRNVRKLVRAEINRVLTSRDFE